MLKVRQCGALSQTTDHCEHPLNGLARSITPRSLPAFCDHPRPVLQIKIDKKGGYAEAAAWSTVTLAGTTTIGESSRAHVGAWHI